MVGQDHITTTLKNQIATNRVGHAYLFVGSRGCGKTTTARILAKEINLAGHESDAAFNARIAEGISEGRALDLIEIDAASHTGVDAMRDVIDKAVFQPSEWRYKVYIIDEVHMLSQSAFNALLKTLEEPPPHVVFILATTDPQKIPATVLSRCQRFNFRRVPVKLIVQRLHTLCSGEGIEADEHALMLIARYATGSLRDAISLLDQLASSNSLRITADDVREALGASDSATVRALMDGLVARDAAAGMDAIQSAIDQGADARQIARQMVDYLRAILQVKVSQKDTQAQSGELSESEKLDLVNYTDKISSAQLLNSIRAFSTAVNDMRGSLDGQLLLEMAYLECVIADAPGTSAPQKADEAAALRTASGSEARTQPAEDKSHRPDARSPRTETAGPIQRETPPVDSAAGSGATIEALRSRWKQLIAEVNTVNKPAAALLRSCHPYSIESDIVRIKADHDLFRERLNDPKNRDVVTATLNQLLNGKFVVQVFTGQPEQEPDPNDDPLLKAARKLGGQLRE